LRKFTVQDAEWYCLDVHDKAIQEIQELVCRSPVLKYFDPNQELILYCDASRTGLGASLSQNGQPKAYASRALNDAETCNAQIEKETLTIAFAL
jgi:hypothetical protein